jgi:acid phosphatase type 7
MSRRPIPPRNRGLETDRSYLSRYLFSLLLLVCAMLCGLPVHSQSQQAAAPPAITVTPGTRSFVVWGDIRFTDPAECDKSDPDVRQTIVQAIAAVDPRPDFAILTGDVVYHGHDSHDWDIFDKQTKPLRDSKIRIFPVLGNHDVDGGSGRPDFFKHFADLKNYSQLEKNGWYSMVYGDSLFLMLDSQLDYRADSPQGTWLRTALKGVPDDLEFLFIVLHHPIVSHASTGLGRIRVCREKKTTFIAPHRVEDNERDLKLILEEFSQNHPLTRLLVFSGHNHNYERYVEKRITYIVTGGGGATPYLVKRDPSDAYHDMGPTFHYCKISMDDTGLVFGMFKLNPEGGSWKQSDTFQLPRLSKALSQQ